jgi:hypothetical protein
LPIEETSGFTSLGANLNLENPLTGHNHISDSFGGINFAGQFAESSYNALNVSVRTNMHGLSLIPNYNWAHEFDDFMVCLSRIRIL